MGALLSVSDLLYLGLSKESKYGITIPSKTYAYLSAGKPILAAVTGDTAKLIRKNNVGIVTPPEDSIQIASALRNAILGDRSILEAMGRRAKDLSNNEFAGQVIAAQYAEIFSTL